MSTHTPDTNDNTSTASRPQLTANDVADLFTQFLQARGSMTPEATSPTPRVPAATSITFESHNRLKDDMSYPHWHRALRASVPTPVFTYLQTGDFPTDWPAAIQEQWKDYVRSVLFTSLDKSLQVVADPNDSPHDIYTELKARFSPRDAQAYAKLVERFWSMPQIPLTSKVDFNKHVDSDLALAREIRSGNLDIEQVLVAARLFNANFNEGLSAWRQTYLQLHEGKDKLPSLEDMVKSMRNAAYHIIDKRPLAYVSKSDPPPSPCPACKTGAMHWVRECPDDEAKKRFYDRPRPNRYRGTPKPSAQARLALAPAEDDCAADISSVSFAATSLLSATSDASSLLLDSAASHHMVNDSSAFIDLHDTPRNRISGVGGALSSQGKGSIELIASTGDRIRLTDVLYVPGCPANLISMFALIKDGVTPTFADDGRFLLVKCHEWKFATLDFGLPAPWSSALSPAPLSSSPTP